MRLRSFVGKPTAAPPVSFVPLAPSTNVKVAVPPQRKSAPEVTLLVAQPGGQRLTCLSAATRGEVIAMATIQAV